MEKKQATKCVAHPEFDSTERDLLSDIKSIVDESAIYITDSECVDEMQCYENVIVEILHLADIEGVRIEISEDEQSVCLSLHDVRHTIDLSDNSDYISEDKLLKGLNEFLGKIRNPGKLYWFWNCDWGQEIGFLYTEKIDEIEALVNSANSPLEYGEISDGLS